MKKRESFSTVMIVVILILFALLCILPFYYVITVSLSDPNLVSEGRLILYPRGVTIKAYEMILRDRKFFQSFWISIQRTVIGTGIAIVIQSFFAYGLSRNHLIGRRMFKGLIIFAILFNGGIIPTYLVVCYTGIFDTLWALLLPIAMSPWNVIILTSFFSSLPVSLEESAKIDGANDLTVFFSIAVPLSMPAIATILLFISVSHWNTLMDAVIFINNTKLKPLQAYLVDLVMRSSTQNMYANPSEQDIPTLSIQTAAIFSSTLPILLVYPFIQRYFVKGVMLGAIKG
ncbi:MAG: carbohydrate ABC transporter permease [Clostridiaceae bacterium]